MVRNELINESTLEYLDRKANLNEEKEEILYERKPVFADEITDFI